MHYSVIICVALIATPMAMVVGESCSPGWSMINGKCYKYYDDKRSYDDAERICQSNGARLVWLEDYTETSAVAFVMAGKKDFWIGARYEGDKIVGSDGNLYDEYDVGFWYKGQPNRKKGECVVLKDKGKKKGLAWELKKCKDNKEFLCQSTCEAGEVYCEGLGCVSDISFCKVDPPTTSCNDEVVFSDIINSLKSTGYSTTRKYPKSSTCTYKISSEEGKLLKIIFEVFNLDLEGQDYVEVYVGSTNIAYAEFYGRFTSLNSPEGKAIFSSNHEMVVVLVSDSRQSKDGRGFSILSLPYTVPDSLVNEVVSVPLGEIYPLTSPEFTANTGELPSYSGFWTVRAPTAYGQLLLWMDKSTRLAEGSVVEIFGVIGDDSFLLARFTDDDLEGDKDGPKIISITQTCYVTYSSMGGPHWNSRGFKLNVKVFESNFAITFPVTHGVITSPGYNLTYGVDNNVFVPYPLNFQVTYTILIPGGKNLTFWFDEIFGLDNGDEIKLIPNSGEEVIIEGDSSLQAPSTVYTASKFVDIHFTTDFVFRSPEIEGVLGFAIYFSMDCPVLEVTEWTQLSRTYPYQYDDVVNINCAEGYEFQDDYWEGTEATIKCLMGGVWNVTRIPQCQPVFCDRPDSIENGYIAMSDGYQFGGVVMYKCYDGLELIGNENITCQANKEWSEEPSCAEVTCTLVQPEEAYASYVLRSGSAKAINDTTFSYGAIVEVKCDAGYYVKGVMSIYCAAANQWNVEELGTCEKIHCPYVPVLNGLMTTESDRENAISTNAEAFKEAMNNATFLYQWFTVNGLNVNAVLFEETANVWCREGYVINGTSSPVTTLSCLADGTYNDTIACVELDECEADIDDCEQDCVNTAGSYYCTCAEQYNLTNSVNCTMIPGCEANPESCDHNCESVDLPEWFKCSCNEPYVLYTENGAEGWPKHSTDLDDGKLRVNQSCVLPQCPLEDIVAGFNEWMRVIVYNASDSLYPRHYNDSVKVVCDRGYKFEDDSMSKIFKCRKNGETLGWFDESDNALGSQFCTEVKCGFHNFTTPEVLQCEYPFNFNITNVCDLNIATGTYETYPDIQCPVVDCGEPAQAQTLGSTALKVNCTTLGCSFEFSCYNGTDILPPGVPSTTVVCQPNGVWNYSSLYCEGTTCSDPGSPPSTYRYADSSYSTTFTLSNLKMGGKIYYKCIRDGYELFLKSTGERVTYSMCNGTEFSPPVDDMECRDTDNPEVEYCPEEVRVLMYEPYNAYPFNASVEGYSGPAFRDNTGIMMVSYPTFAAYHNDYRFTEDKNITFEARDFSSETNFSSCTVRFVVVDVKTPKLNCSDLYIPLNSTHSEVNVTSDMILAQVSYDSDVNSIQTVQVSLEDYYTLTADNMQASPNYQVKVSRMYYYGDVAMGDQRDAKIVSTSCVIAVIPDIDECDLLMAPSPAQAEKSCLLLDDGFTTECNYTCADGYNFILGDGLTPNVTSQCVNGSGYDLVRDCSADAVATSFTRLIFFSDKMNDDCFSLFKSLVFKKWLLEVACENLASDITYESSTINNDAFFVGNPQLFFKMKSGNEGLQQYCVDRVKALLQDGGLWKQLESYDAVCFSNVKLNGVGIDKMNFSCSSVDLNPVQAGEHTAPNNQSYPYYKCAVCPAGTYLDGTSCLNCPIGTFSRDSGTRQSCLSCPSGSTNIKEASTSCQLLCSPGFVSETGIAPCTPCPVGTYSVDSTTCEACPEGTIGRENGQSSNDSCRALCEPGYYSEDGYAPVDGDCTACPELFYQPNNGSKECLRCSDGQTTNGLSAQTSCSDLSECPNFIYNNCKKPTCSSTGVSFFCPDGCKEGFRGSDCQEVLDVCDTLACDSRGSTGCADGQCICNPQVATGDLCDNFTTSISQCDDLACANGAECFIKQLNEEPGANTMAVCLCGGPWSGELCDAQEDKCSDSPCNATNTASCTSQVVRAECNCRIGFTGYACEIDIDGCMSDPCYNGGRCKDRYGLDLDGEDVFSFDCECPEGFAGKQCEIWVDECQDKPCGDDGKVCVNDYGSVNSTWCLTQYFLDPVPASVSTDVTTYCAALDIECLNGGNCVEDKDEKFKCECPNTHVGVFCEVRIDFCEGNPCGPGECTNEVNGEYMYSCSCNEGYTFSGLRKTCTDIDECSGDGYTCAGGDCNNTEGSFYCDCYDGYAGFHCETQLNECLFSPCNAGTCVDKFNDFQCTCPQNRTGKRCEFEANLCDDQCLNDGECRSVFDSYSCICEEPAYGVNCENVHNICSTENPCAYGGDCSVDGNQITCDDCDSGHAGQYCQLWTHECTENPCENGGTCDLEYWNGYSCSCPEGWTGGRCQLKINDPCSSNPCPSNSECFAQSPTTYSCICESGFAGPRCNEVIDSNFTIYIWPGSKNSILNPIKSPNWDIKKFSLSAWIRPDKIFNDEGNPIPIIHITVDEEVILSISHCGTTFNGQFISHNIDASKCMSQGVWTFLAISVDATLSPPQMTVYYGGVRNVILNSIPEPKYGTINIIQSPEENFQGFLTQINFWAGASFIKGVSTALLDLITYTKGLAIFGTAYKTDYILYFWTLSSLDVSPFCEIVRKPSYCTTCGDEDKGVYLSFDQKCPDDIYITTSSRYTTVEWNPPTFLANGQSVGVGFSNYKPGDIFGLGKHEVKYTLNYNGRQLSCKFKIYVRYGCDGIMIGRKCYKRVESSSYTLLQARSRCNNLGFVLLSISDPEQEDAVIQSVIEQDYAGVFMIDSHYNKSSSPVCLSIENQEYTLIDCPGGTVTYVLCQRPIAATEACVLPDLPSSVRAVEVKDSRYTKYQLECKDDGYQLSSYTPRYLTCYPEGNWDFDGTVTGCSKVVDDSVKFRFKLRVTCRVRIQGDCVGLNQYSVLFSVKEWLLKLSSRWQGKLFGKKSKKVKYCCNGNDCDEPAPCKGSKYALATTCSQFSFGRRKRATESEIELDIALDELPQDITNGTTLEPAQILQQAIADGELADAINSGVVSVTSDPSYTINSLAITTSLDCEPGYAADNDLQECVACPAGTYEVNSTCVSCEVDTYQDLDANDTCKTCPADRTTYVEGATREDQCQPIAEAGQFYDGTSIQNCSIGFYQDQPGQQSCIPCPVGETTASTRSIAQSDCQNTCSNGQEALNDGCADCQIGFYRDAAINPGGCQKCPDGFITLTTGSTSVADCNIIDCNAGTYRDVDTNKCEDCPLEQYQDVPRMTGCKPCGENYTTEKKGSSLQSQCIFICPSGYEKVESVDSCTLCPIGTYRTRDRNVEKCAACPEFFVTEQTGASVEENCTILQCPAGMQANSGNSSCEDCPVGAYSDSITLAGQTCKPCSDSYTTETLGSNSSESCLRYCEDGFEYDGTNCVQCKEWQYKNNTDGKLEMCKNCTDNKLTLMLGATSESQCIFADCQPGYQINNGSSHSCEPCPVGYYQPERWQFNCIQCPDPGNFTTDTEGSTSESDCKLKCLPAGYEANENNTACVPCKVGYYKQENVSSCSPCGDGFTTKTKGSTAEADCSVAVCRAGHYRDADAETCKDCGAGWYQENDNHTLTSCTQCPKIGDEDQTTNGTNSTSVSDCLITCDAGKEDRDDKCQPCLKGFYKAVAGHVPCTPCGTDPTKLTTANEESKDAASCNIAVCQAGRFSSGAACETCPIGTYQSENDFEGSKCTSCSQTRSGDFNQTTDSAGATSASSCRPNCPAGYKVNSASDDCEGCPVDTYGDGIKCEPCPSDFSTGGEVKRTSVNECNYRICEAGQKTSSSDPNICVSCPLHTYNEVKGGKCLTCPDDRYGIPRITLSTGTSDDNKCIMNCSLGSFYDARKDECFLCAKGNYRNRFDLTECQICSEGYTTLGEGSTECNVVRCSAGSYASKDSNYTVCVGCPFDEYQSEDGQTSCIKCADGKLTAATNSTKATQCVNDPCADKCSDKEECLKAATEYQCACLSAYDKQSDGSCKHVCSRAVAEEKYCLNDGVCNDAADLSNLVCTCSVGWQGSRCNVTSDARTDSANRNTLIIAGVVSGVVLLGAAIAVITALAKGACSPSTPKQYMANPHSDPPMMYYDGSSVPRNALPYHNEMNPQSDQDFHHTYVRSKRAPSHISDHSQRLWIE